MVTEVSVSPNWNTPRTIKNSWTRDNRAPLAGHTRERQRGVDSLPSHHPPILRQVNQRTSPPTRNSHEKGRKGSTRSDTQSGTTERQRPRATVSTRKQHSLDPFNVIRHQAARSEQAMLFRTHSKSLIDSKCLMLSARPASKAPP